MAEMSGRTVRREEGGQLNSAPHEKVGAPNLAVWSRRSQLRQPASLAIPSDTSDPPPPRSSAAPSSCSSSSTAPPAPLSHTSAPAEERSPPSRVSSP